MGQEDWADYAGLSDEANTTAAQYLDKQGVDPKFYSEPFLEVSEFGDASTLRQRLAQLSGDEKRHLVRSVDQHGCTGLLLFAKKGDSEMVDILLDGGAIANDADNSGVTALHYAAGRGSAAMVKSLLDFRADAEAKDDQNETALMWARGEKTINLLLEARSDPSVRNSSGQTALMLASRNGDEEAIRVLARLPDVDVNACDSQGCSAHAIALSAGHIDAAELLQSLGAKGEVKASSRILRCEDAFLEAARRGDAEACAGFLKEGINIEAEGGGETALLLAAGGAHSRAVETLLRGRADPNHADAFMGETPLIRAVLGRSSNETLWMLLEAKADPVQKDVGGRMPADIAANWGYTEATDILKAAAAGELSLECMD